jgi:NAD(P)-dependent dehydrogenase (short-subunit alcohol dehydrogenase family)
MAVAGRVVLIVNAGEDPGRTLALRFARDGAALALCDPDAVKLAETALLCGERVHSRVASLADAIAVGRLFAETYARYGAIDALILAPCRAADAGLLMRPFAEWERVVAADLIGAARCVHHALPGMVERSYGRIVAFVLAADPAPAEAARTTRDAGVLGLMRAVTRELERRHCKDVLFNALVLNEDELAADLPVGAAEALYRRVRRLVDLPAGGLAGRVFGEYSEPELRAPEGAVPP